MTQTNQVPNPPILVPQEVFARYRWGHTKGYELLTSEGFPPGRPAPTSST